MAREASKGKGRDNFKVVRDRPVFSSVPVEGSREAVHNGDKAAEASNARGRLVFNSVRNRVAGSSSDRADRRDRDRKRSRRWERMRLGSRSNRRLWCGIWRSN